MSLTPTRKLRHNPKQQEYSSRTVKHTSALLTHAKLRKRPMLQPKSGLHIVYIMYRLIDSGGCLLSGCISAVCNACCNCHGIYMMGPALHHCLSILNRSPHLQTNARMSAARSQSYMHHGAKHTHITPTQSHSCFALSAALSTTTGTYAIMATVTAVAKANGLLQTAHLLEDLLVQLKPDRLSLLQC